MNAVGRLLIIAGGVLIAVGLLLVFGPRIPYLGKLPGDLHLEGENWSFYLPLTTCLLLSIVLTLLLNLVLSLFSGR